MATVLLAIIAGVTLVATPSAHAAPQSGFPDPVAIPQRNPADFTTLIAYSFGNRIPAGADAARTVGEPGPVNEKLAAAVMRTRADRDIPVYAQTEIAQVLTERYGLADVVEIPPDRKADGTLVYLSTDGVAAKVKALRGASAISDTVGIIAFADHQWRSVYTTRANGLAAYAPAGITMPATYDPQSGQAWTRSRAAYLPTDYAARLALLPRLITTR